MLESIGHIKSAKGEVANKYSGNEGCGNIPLDDLACNKISKADEQSDSAGLTDSTAVNTDEKL